MQLIGYTEGMQHKSFESMNCSIAQTLEVVGEWWSVLIVRDAFLGVTRFDDFHQRLGISRNILTSRLEHLIGRGVLEKVAYQEHPVRYDYHLTEKGRDLWVVLAAMRQWGDRWEAPNGAPVVMRHENCGHVGAFVPICESCGEPLTRGDLTPMPGPGALPGQAPLPFVGAR
jgi:DNA-binding HxlR family transcriptional regulator